MQVQKVLLLLFNSQWFPILYFPICVTGFGKFWSLESSKVAMRVFFSWNETCPFFFFYYYFRIVNWMFCRLMSNQWDFSCAKILSGFLSTKIITKRPTPFPMSIRRSAQWLPISLCVATVNVRLEELLNCSPNHTMLTPFSFVKTESSEMDFQANEWYHTIPSLLK